ncbi:lipoxygenase family protein [Iningainema tapete]|uniref:Lipoxygenase n=1 Tax=Iningainema tapete BLCC-T55 TaxID=2748662 RepID=A0A8J6XHM7_9CYAN|nr:lipoxygenase family protein [Iningainema tapete]MBD2770796.1 lipoxygenase [Iningainema tapete BLCC-T55]
MTASQSNLNSVTDNLDPIRQEYQYNYTRIPPLAMISELPPSEEFSKAWYRLLAKEIRVLFLNTLITNRGNRGSASLRDDVRNFIFEVVREEALTVQLTIFTKILQIAPQLLLKRLSNDYREIDELLFSIIKDGGLSIFRDLFRRINDRLDRGQPTGHATSVDDYRKLYPRINLPPIAKTFQEDESFAYMQVAGFNPVMIERVYSLSDRFSLEDTQYQEIMGSDDSLTTALQEGRLYQADYQILEGALNGTFRQYQKYLSAPRALFAVPKGSEPSRLLRTVAIEIGHPGASQIFTPKSPKYAWLFAKALVQIADANYHEPITHLARTHLFVGAFVMATHRQLPKTHPLSLLLRPHFEGTLAINDAAQRVLIAPGGSVDRLLSSTIDNSRILAVFGVQSYGFNSAMLPKQFKQRGVDDPNLLPVYPYRDDALLVWDAIHQWVSDYLNLYYSTDEDVYKDTALQAWAAEVQALDGGRIPDFGENGGIKTRDYLVDAVTLIIFTASAQHAAVNFPQKDLMSYAPALPLAGYLPTSTLLGEVSEQDYLNLLPPFEQAQRQINLLQLLGSVYYNTLGKYSEAHFSDQQVKPLLQAFQENLQQVEDTIKQRNENRPPYEYLLPSRIPQSINI